METNQKFLLLNAQCTRWSCGQAKLNVEASDVAKKLTLFSPLKNGNDFLYSTIVSLIYYWWFQLEKIFPENVGK